MKARPEVQTPDTFLKKLKTIHSQALAHAAPATVEAARHSEQAQKLRTEFSALASRLNREIIMPALIRFAEAIPDVHGPREANTKLDEDFDSYDACCEVAPVTSPGKPVKLRIRVMPDTLRAGITVECEMTSREAELFHDATDFPLISIDERKLQKWLENAIADAYQRFCELNYPPAPR
jgi:hypothetical protein